MTVVEVEENDVLFNELANLDASRTANNNQNKVPCHPSLPDKSFSLSGRRMYNDSQACVKVEIFGDSKRTLSKTKLLTVEENFDSKSVHSCGDSVRWPDADTEQTSIASSISSCYLNRRSDSRQRGHLMIENVEYADNGDNAAFHELEEENKKMKMELKKLMCEVGQFRIKEKTYMSQIEDISKERDELKVVINNLRDEMERTMSKSSSRGGKKSIWSSSKENSRHETGRSKSDPSISRNKNGLRLGFSNYTENSTPDSYLDTGNIDLDDIDDRNRNKEPQGSKWPFGRRQTS